MAKEANNTTDQSQDAQQPHGEAQQTDWEAQVAKDTGAPANLLHDDSHSKP